MTTRNLGVLWAQYGPYHFARVEALRRQAALEGGWNVHALEMGSQTADYAWTRNAPFELATLCPGAVAERLSFRAVFLAARRVFSRLKLDVCILPSYAPKQSLAAFLAAKTLGISTVMMNESHAGTARTRGISALVKSRLVRAFDAGLVGGQPQKRYFESLGMPPEKIFTGYDAVDNDFFSEKSDGIRAASASWRVRFSLPERYFLSLGRFVAKKNLSTLIEAYGEWRAGRPPEPVHLVMVGSGEEEVPLKALCRKYHLPIYDHAGATGQSQAPETVAEQPGVHFYGFRQIEENPVFYALAEAFVLPSAWEEWGLVVNEAMACKLPVVVSDVVGCAEDLLPVLNKSDLKSHPDSVMAGMRTNGFVFPPGSASGLKKILARLASDPDLRLTMGQAGRQIVESVSCGVFARNALASARAALGVPSGVFEKVGEPAGTVRHP